VLHIFQYSKDPKKETFGFTRPKSPIDPKQQEPKAHTFSKNEIAVIANFQFQPIIIHKKTKDKEK
jgi:hypothetical protein